MNLSALLQDERLARHGDGPAVRQEGEEWSLGELARRAGVMAAGLAEAGAGRGAGAHGPDGGMVACAQGTFQAFALPEPA